MGLLPDVVFTRRGGVLRLVEMHHKHLLHLWGTVAGTKGLFTSAVRRELARRKWKVPYMHPKQPPEVQDIVTCGECSSLMILRTGSNGLFYGCSQWPKCKATHGAHADGRPLGIPADGETRRARMDAHLMFDQLWQSNQFIKRTTMSRSAAYRWMQKTLNLTSDEAHIGRFTKEQCATLISAVRVFLENANVKAKHEAERRLKKETRRLAQEQLARERNGGAGGEDLRSPSDDTD